MTELNYNYLDGLNTQQREAVKYIQGPQLVIAGAGSGKTRVLTHKIVHLIRNGVPADRIMALTFTNKAAKEMKSRIADMVEPRLAYRIWSGTFHSIFLRILRKHADRLGFKSNFTIYDTADSKSLIKSLIKEKGLDDKKYKASTVLNSISNAKNALITPDIYFKDKDNMQADKKAGRPMTGELYKAYMERCRIAQSMDFDDILLYMNILLRDNPDIKEYYADFFRYILVDEYQDTNFAQHLIVHQLSSRHNAICVVGDDAQSIYSFRGANITNILTLEQRYPGLRVFKLERNYRSTKHIVEAADSLIAKNTKQIQKKVFSEKADGERLKILKTYSDLEEATLVATMIMQQKNTWHDSLDDYAILYRTNAQSRTLEEALRKKNLSYRIYGGLSFYQRKEIKDAIAYFRLAINPQDDEAFKRIVNYPTRGIGDTTIKKLQAAASEHGVSMLDVTSHPDEYNLNINSGTRKKLEAFSAMILDFVSDNEKSNAYELAQLVYNRTGLLAVLKDEKTPEEISKKENLLELLTGIKEFIDLRIAAGETDLSMTSFLNEVSLATDQDEEDSDSQHKVTLMTAHAAKGLEFKHIYVVGVEEELFPNSLAMNSLVEIEEERRLLYVAITRAKETCVLTYSGTRFRNGQTVLTKPSRFLAEIDRSHVETVSTLDLSLGSTAHPLANPEKNYYDSFSNRPKVKNTHLDYTTVKKIETSSDGRLKVGNRINHTIFGNGTIDRIEDVSGEDIIIVKFDKAGQKKLMLKYAKFTVI